MYIHLYCPENWPLPTKDYLPLAFANSALFRSKRYLKEDALVLYFYRNPERGTAHLYLYEMIYSRHYLPLPFE